MPLSQFCAFLSITFGVGIQPSMSVPLLPCSFHDKLLAAKDKVNGFHVNNVSERNGPQGQPEEIVQKEEEKESTPSPFPKDEKHLDEVESVPIQIDCFVSFIITLLSISIMEHLKI